jgi:hypothetical protein
MSNVRPRTRPVMRTARRFTVMLSRSLSTHRSGPRTALVAAGTDLRPCIRALSPRTAAAREWRSSALHDFTQASARSQDQNNNQSAAALQAPPRVNVGQFVGAGAVAPAGSGRLSSQWCRLWRSGSVLVAPAARETHVAWPNPSIEGTSNGGAHWFAPSGSATPLAAPHVKR